MKDLVLLIAEAIENYKDEKLSNMDIDSDIEYQIYKTIEKYKEKIEDKLQELDDDIDTLIEQMNEPSDKEVWNEEYERQREVEFN